MEPLVQNPFALFFFLLAGHALADFPLQNRFIALGKNRNTEVGREIWPYALSAHGLIHGGVVALVTGSVTLGLAETIAHAVIDWTKCEGRISIHADQASHVACKILWVMLALASGTASF